MAVKSPEQRAKLNERARARYAKMRAEEQMRSFLKRVREKPEYRPQMDTLKELGIDLAMVNKIRAEAGFPAIESTTIRGRGRVQAELMRGATKAVSKDAVTASIIPEVTVQEGASETRVRRVHHEDKNALVDIPTYFACLAKKLTNDNRLRQMQGYMERILGLMGYKEGSIIPFVSDFDLLKKTIDGLRTQEGEEYALQTKQDFWYTFSTGLNKGFCVAYSHQIDKKASLLITTYMDVLMADTGAVRRERKRTAKYVSWNDVVRPKLAAFLADPNQSVEERAIVAVYSQLGGLLRIGTPVKLHVTDDLEAARASRDKNWLVLHGDKVTLVLNAHKTGNNKGKGGKTIELELDDRGKKYESVAPSVIGQWLRSIAPPVGQVMWPGVAAKAAAIFKRLLGKQGTNTELRHSQETWVQRSRDLELIARASYVNGHSIKMAKDYYAN